MSSGKTRSKTQGGKQRDAKNSSASLTSKNRNAILCVLLAAVTIALYSPVIGYSFIVLDDHDYVTANAHIRGGLHWNTVKWAFTSTEAANWHPLTWLSHALDYQLFALNPAGHHLDSVLIHALNAVLLFLLLVWVTKRVGPSLLVAALFALHPVNVESVAWVAERKNVLSTFFFFLAIGAYIRYTQKPDWQRYLLMAALFAAGLMAKPMVITLPFVLLLLDYWPLGRTAGSPPSVVHVPQATISGLLLEKIPLFCLSVASALITLRAQRSGMAVRSLHQYPFVIRIENAIVAYGLYLWKMLWPTRLALYPHSAIALPAWQWTLSALVLIAITVAVVVSRGRGYLPVGWFWFLGTLVPVIGLVQVGEASMADRYAYVPLIGIFVMIAFGLADFAKATNVRLAWQVFPALCAFVALSFLTHRQMSYWECDYDLWAHALEVTENPVAHDAMGSALLDPDFAISPNDHENLDTQQKRMDEARQHFERALDMRRQLAGENAAAYLPDMANTLNNLGNLDRLQRRTDDARKHYQEALKIHLQLSQQNMEPFPPDLAQTLDNLATLEKDTAQMEDARRHFEGALNIYREMALHDPDAYLPKVAEVLNSLGFVDRVETRMEEARQQYEEALKIRRLLSQQDSEAYQSDLATTLNDLGILDAQQNRKDEARRHYEEALQDYRQLAEREPSAYLPYLAATLNNLALLDESQNRVEEARAHYQEDLRVYRELFQNDSEKYAGDVARVETRLEDLGRKTPDRPER